MFTQLPAVQLISYPHIFHPSYFPYQEQNKNFPKGTGSSQLLALNALSCCLFVSLFQALLAAASQGCCCLAAYLFPSPRPLFSALFFCFKPDGSGIARQSWLSFPGAVGQRIDVDGARSPASQTVLTQSCDTFYSGKARSIQRNWIFNLFSMLFSA